MLREVGSDERGREVSPGRKTLIDMLEAVQQENRELRKELEQGGSQRHNLEAEYCSRLEEV